MNEAPKQLQVWTILVSSGSFQEVFGEVFCKKSRVYLNETKQKPKQISASLSARVSS